MKKLAIRWNPSRYERVVMRSGAYVWLGVSLFVSLVPFFM